MHPRNIHNTSYDFIGLCKAHEVLSQYLIFSPNGRKSIDFSDNRAVLALNKAILKNHYRLNDWNIPEGYLCPPIPGRADYIHHIADLLEANEKKTGILGLDIGVGANCIYTILGSQIYHWKMVGADVSKVAVSTAKANVDLTPELRSNIEIRHQKDNANIFNGVIYPDEYYHFTMCNPPFHASEDEAKKSSLQKLNNLSSKKSKTSKVVLNFGGQANELWCNGGEALFIKRMIKQSVDYKTQVGWFTCLISKKENLPKIYKLLNKVKANHVTIEMSQGKKQSRFVAWNFRKN
ncbi:23S rRNA (adenine(1618)-N(6))-methyltransferase RlmF [Aquimarina sp. SS2-1]|uniref:23S rRNA (adenine(1618)-N(6))-methyltransferase RlmF n=1 Tax=Aquimarina besae TaxID=3342247 RepID=UPI00366A5889